MEEMNTHYLCKFLGQNGISDKAIAILKEENISGAVFPELEKEELKGMGLPVGDVKLVLKLQAEHMPKTTQVSHKWHHKLSIIMCASYTSAGDLPYSRKFSQDKIFMDFAVGLTQKK